MPDFAVIENNVVINTIVANDQATAESTTEKMCIEYTDQNPAGIDWTWDGTYFIPPKPYVSWILNLDRIWEAPTARPTDGKTYRWDEESLSWVEVISD